MLNQFQDEVGDACEFFKSSEYVGGQSLRVRRHSTPTSGVFI